MLEPGEESAPSHGILESDGVRVVICPPRAPNCNTFAERFVRSIKSKCPDRMIILSTGSLRHAPAEYTEHYHRERNHEGICNRPIEQRPRSTNRVGETVRRSRLAELLNYYGRAA